MLSAYDSHDTILTQLDAILIQVEARLTFLDLEVVVERLSELKLSELVEGILPYDCVPPLSLLLWRLVNQILR